MNNTDRAAQLIEQVPTIPVSFGGEVDGHAVAEALAAAGLLVTDEIQAVIDAADALAEEWIGHARYDLELAVTAWRASRDTA